MESKVIRLPNPSLNQVSQKVEQIDQKIKHLIAEMKKQAANWEKGRKYEITVGLAAIQIDQPLAIILIREDFDPRKPAAFNVLINPRIVSKSDKIKTAIEGCLSVPDYYMHVPRAEKIKVVALNENGEEIKFKASGFLSRVLQHECDHLAGLTIVDRAIEARDSRGRKFKFCQLGQSGKYEPIEDAEIKLIAD